MPKTIYLDNAATTPLSRSFIEDSSYYFNLYGNASTPYGIGREAKHEIDNARNYFARNFRCEPEQLYFTSGSTEGINWTLSGFDCVITDATEHEAVLETIKAQTTWIKYVPVDGDGVVSTKALREILQELKDNDFLNKYSTCVSIMAVNNETGTIQPIKEISDICSEFGVFFHIDATQAIGHILFDVVTYPCDAFTCSGHKFYGMKGIGIQYFKNPPVSMLYGGGQERGYRAGTENVFGIASMMYGYSEAMEDMRYLEHISLFLLNALIVRFGDNFVLNGSPDKKIPSTINFALKGVNNKVLQTELDIRSICVGTGSACSSGEDKPSHVLSAMGIDDDTCRSSIRVSLGIYNTMDEIGAFVNTLEEIYNNITGRN